VLKSSDEGGRGAPALLFVTRTKDGRDALARATGLAVQIENAPVACALARYLGAGLSMVITAVNPSRIFIGGEITEAWERIEPIVGAAITDRALTPAAAATPIIPDSPTSFPCLRGATTLVTAPCSPRRAWREAADRPLGARHP
jgi:hypothetical protein